MSTHEEAFVMSVGEVTDEGHHQQQQQPQQQQQQQQNGLDVSVSPENAFDPFTIGDDGSISHTPFAFPHHFDSPTTESTPYALPLPPFQTPPQTVDSLQPPAPIQTQDESQHSDLAHLLTSLQPFESTEYASHVQQAAPTPAFDLGYANSTTSPVAELCHSFDPPSYSAAPWYPSGLDGIIPQQPTPSLPEFSHSTTPSYASLASVVTAPSLPPAQVNVFATTFGDDSHSYPGSEPISRQTSMSSISSLVKPFETPQMTSVHSTPGKMSSMRSLSRVAPYPQPGRHGRSDSVSSNVSNMSSTRQFWNSGSGLESPLNRMSLAQPSLGNLRHRRSQSRTSGTWTSLSSANVNRPRVGRSASVSILQSHNGPNDIPLANIAGLDDRADYIHAKLSELAQHTHSLRHHAAQHDKARSNWVRQWLRLSYSVEHHAGQAFTVPRKGMYASYEQSCKYYHVKPINSASFGKAVKGAYPNIKTRRLGKRGDSHYHLIAVRPTTTIEAERLNAHDRLQPAPSRGHWYPNHSTGTIEFQSTMVDHAFHHDYEDVEAEESDVEEEEEVSQPIRRSTSEWSLSVTSEAGNSFARSTLSRHQPRPTLAPRRHTMSGMSTPPPASSVHTRPTTQLTDLAGFPTVDQVLFASSGLGDAQRPWASFCQHLQFLIGCAGRADFSRWSDSCAQFWTSLSGEVRDAWQGQTMGWIIETALQVVLKHVLGCLVDQVIDGPGLTPEGHIGLSHLAESLEDIYAECWSDFDDTFKIGKLETIGRVAHALQRISPGLSDMCEHISLSLSNAVQLRQLLESFGRLDVAHIAEQCALSTSVTTMSAEVIPDLLDGLFDILRNRPSTIGLAQWLKRVIEINQGGLPPSSIAIGIQIITAEIVRDVWLRSDASLSDFQLLKLWLDEYVNIWALRQTLSTLSDPTTQTHQTMDTYVPLSIGVPQVTAYDGDLPTAVPARTQDVGSLASYSQGYSNSLAPPIDVDTLITPRQNLSMSDLIEPKLETPITQ